MVDKEEKQATIVQGTPLKDQSTDAKIQAVRDELRQVAQLIETIKFGTKHTEDMLRREIDTLKTKQTTIDKLFQNNDIQKTQPSRIQSNILNRPETPTNISTAAPLQKILQQFMGKQIGNQGLPMSPMGMSNMPNMPNTQGGMQTMLPSLIQGFMGHRGFPFMAGMGHRGDMGGMGMPFGRSHVGGLNFPFNGIQEMGKMPEMGRQRTTSLFEMSHATRQHKGYEETPSMQGEQTSPMQGATNPRLSGDRSSFFNELDKNPELKQKVIQAALAEGGQKGLQANIEQMANYSKARGFHSFNQALNSGFYGPVNRGTAFQHQLTSSDIKKGDAALDAVRGGSNLLEYRTDQGMQGDPNFDKEKNDPRYRMKNIGGSWFADHPMFNTKDGGSRFRDQQIKADIEYNKEHPQQTQSLQKEATQTSGTKIKAPSLAGQEPQTKQQEAITGDIPAMGKPSSDQKNRPYHYGGTLTVGEHEFFGCAKCPFLMSFFEY